MMDDASILWLTHHGQTHVLGSEYSLMLPIRRVRQALDSCFNSIYKYEWRIQNPDNL